MILIRPIFCNMAKLLQQGLTFVPWSYYCSTDTLLNMPAYCSMTNQLQYGHIVFAWPNYSSVTIILLHGHIIAAWPDYCSMAISLLHVLTITAWPNHCFLYSERECKNRLSISMLWRFLCYPFSSLPDRLHCLNMLVRFYTVCIFSNTPSGWVFKKDRHTGHYRQGTKDSARKIAQVVMLFWGQT
jgi:hypothetical protein